MHRDELLKAFPEHRRRLMASLARIVGPVEAEDVVHETLLKALAACENFRGEAALGTWLHRIGVNLAYDLLRRQARNPVEATEQLPEPAENAADTDSLDRRQMTQCVQDLLATLPGPQRQLLVQADVLDRTAAEIARDDGIATGNAKIRLHRARRALQAALETQCEFHRRDDGVLCCTPKPA